MDNKFINNFKRELRLEMDKHAIEGYHFTNEDIVKITNYFNENEKESHFSCIKPITISRFGELFCIEKNENSKVVNKLISLRIENYLKHETQYNYILSKIKTLPSIDIKSV